MNLFRVKDIEVEPITKQEFLAGRGTRFGTSNPESFTDPYREKMIRSRMHAYSARGQVKLNPKGPNWCFRRSGMSATVIEDRFIVFIGGEHEDFYDPDFQIYNDVIVRDFEGRIWMFLYPKDAFPPTDFHTATLIGKGTIYIIGGLGYGCEREWWRTPVYKLDLDSFMISEVETQGDHPGWIHSHTAVRTRDRYITISGGEKMAENGVFVPWSGQATLDTMALRWTA